MDTAVGLLAVFVLVFANGFFVAAEFAFVGARRTRIAQLAKEGSRSAKSAEKAIDHLDSYIAATQLGITLASLGLGWIGEPAVAHLFEPIMERFLPHDVIETIGHTITFALAFGLVTTLHIVLGELAPKSIALQRAEDTAIIVARPMTLFHNVFRPIIRLMNGVGNAVVRLIGFEPASGHSQVHSSEELVMLVKSSRQAGLLQESEEQLLRRVFDFGDIDIKEVMQPRVEVDAISIDTTWVDLMNLITKEHHSRYPVYEETIDHVIGILYTKDLLDEVIKQPRLIVENGIGFELRPLLREPLFVPQTVMVDKVLEKMRRTKVHLAIVLDEYGGMAGVATMEDILEELIGEVEDEFDDDIASQQLSGNVLSGLVSISDAVERFGDLATEPASTTIGGYFSENLERMPVVGDTLVFGDYDLSVEEMEGLRVSKVRFVRRDIVPPPSESDSDS